MSELDYVDCNSIQNKDFLEKVKEIILCSICTGLIVDPKQCKNCENNFCNHCISKWLKSSKTCPFKCQDFEIKETTKTVKNILEKLCLDCPHCEMKNLNYDSLMKHIKTCDLLKTHCPTCSSLVEVKQIKEFDLQNKLKDELIQLEEQNEKLLIENKALKDKVKTFDKKTNSDDVELKLKDKCEHYKGNYMPIFSCCNTAFSCYICHDLKNQDHQYEMSNNVICLVCNQIYSGNRCSSCSTIQAYKKK
jgi:hypothetical protein